MKITRKPDGKLRYKYKASSEMSFCFSLLCEVGEPYQNEAKQELKKLEAKGFTIAYGKELPINVKPYYSDYAIKQKK
jgi:hypothetical protein